jgi:GNAT superfamily N-acetyltransferase
MSSNWKINQFEPDDLSKIRLFFKRLYTGIGDYGSIDLFNWKIQENYASTGIINLIKDEKEIVSTTSLTPKFVFLKGKKEIVAEIGDTYTDPDYQRKGMFSLLINQTRKDAETKGIPFIYGTPNEQSLPGYEKKANFKVISGINVRSMAVPLNVSPIISRKTHWIFGELIGYVYLIYIHSIYGLKKFINKTNSIEQIIEFNKIPNNWEDFWEKAHVSYDFIISRDSKALEWRFFNHPNKYKFYILEQQNVIIGYLTYRILHENGITQLFIADYLFLKGNERKLKSVLFKVVKDSTQAGVTLIKVWCPQNSPYFKIFKDFGFMDRGNVPVICYNNKFSSEVQAYCHNWHFTISDSDNI